MNTERGCLEFCDAFIIMQQDEGMHCVETVILAYLQYKKNGLNCIISWYLLLPINSSDDFL
jgi:hypothetical protein